MAWRALCCLSLFLFYLFQKYLFICLYVRVLVEAQRALLHCAGSLAPHTDVSCRPISRVLRASAGAALGLSSPRHVGSQFQTRDCTHLICIAKPGFLTPLDHQSPSSSFYKDTEYELGPHLTLEALSPNGHSAGLGFPYVNFAGTQLNL